MHAHDYRHFLSVRMLGTGHHASVSGLDKAICGAIAAALIFVPPVWATYTANSFEDAWRSIGRSSARWTMLFWVLPFLIGPAAAVFYQVRVRRDLIPFGRIPPITQETPVLIIRGPLMGTVGVASPRRGVLRPVFALTNYVWLRLDTGERVGVARELIEPIWLIPRTSRHTDLTTIRPTDRCRFSSAPRSGLPER